MSLMLIIPLIFMEDFLLALNPNTADISLPTSLISIKTQNDYQPNKKNDHQQ